MLGETILQIVLYITTVINIVLSLVIFSRGLLSPRNFIFGSFTLSAAAWTGSIIGFYYFPYSDPIVSWVTLTHLFALMTAVFFMYFTFFFPQNLVRNSYLVLFIPGLLLLAFAYILLKTNFVVGDIVGFEYELGPAYSLFALLLMASFFCGYYFLIQQLKRAKNEIQRMQTLYVAASGIISPTLAIIPDLILPYFGIYQYTWMGPPFTLIMVVALFIAMVKFHLFNIKVIATEIFASLIVIILLAQLFLATSTLAVVITTIVLIVVAVFSFLLIQSVYREVETREEIQRLAKELEIKNVKLTELDKLKSQFLSIATHELRTPLTIVRNFISLMMDGTYGKVSPAAEEAGRQVFERVSDMARSVDTYLNVSRIEQGKISYSFADADLTRLTTLAVEGLKANATKRGLTLSLTVKPGAESLKGKYDSPKIAEVLINLIDNSIKYTEKGSVTVLVEKVGNRGVVTIQDTGVGMTEKTKANLFKLFSPGEDSKRINPASTGVGLYVSLAHVVAHKGTLTAASDGPGKGSKFTVELPLV